MFCLVFLFVFFTHHIPRHPMITHTNDSHQIPSQNKTKSKLQIKNKLPKIQILQETLHGTHLLKLLDKMYKYEMDPTRTLGATEQARDAGQTDGQTDGWTDGWSKTIYPPTTSLCGGYNNFLRQMHYEHTSSLKWIEQMVFQIMVRNHHF